MDLQGLDGLVAKQWVNQISARSGDQGVRIINRTNQGVVRLRLLNSAPGPRCAVRTINRTIHVVRIINRTIHVVVR